MAFTHKPIRVTEGQMIYEFKHLKKKLWIRDRKKYIAIKTLKKMFTNPLFKTVAGDVERWEKIAG